MSHLCLDFSKIIKQAIPQNTEQPRRSQIYVGFQCHQKCGFCYYKHRCQESMLSLQEIKQQIDFKLAYGIQDFELTGGEPGEFKQLPDVCNYIHEKSPKSKIAVITNGQICTLGKELFQTIDEVLLSYHCSRDAKQDNIFFPAGCTWQKALKSVELAKKHDCLLRTNTVLGTFNLSQLDGIVSDICELQPTIVNFLPVNLFDQASDLASAIDYTKLRPALKKAIKTIEERLPSALIFVRYMPFCDMEGYEKHIVGYLQHIYDWFDWNVELGGAEILDQLKQNGAGPLQDRLGDYGSHSVEEALACRKLFYSKPKKCMSCRFQLICDGLEKQIPIEKQEEFAIPNTSNQGLVKNPLEFYQSETESLYHTIYGIKAQ